MTVAVLITDFWSWGGGTCNYQGSTVPINVGRKFQGEEEEEEGEGNFWAPSPLPGCNLWAAFWAGRKEEEEEEEIWAHGNRRRRNTCWHVFFFLTWKIYAFLVNAQTLGNKRWHKKNIFFLCHLFFGFFFFKLSAKRNFCWSPFHVAFSESCQKKSLLCPIWVFIWCSPPFFIHSSNTGGHSPSSSSSSL